MFLSHQFNLTLSERVRSRVLFKMKNMCSSESHEHKLLLNGLQKQQRNQYKNDKKNISFLLKSNLEVFFFKKIYYIRYKHIHLKDFIIVFWSLFLFGIYTFFLFKKILMGDSLSNFPVKLLHRSVKDWLTSMQHYLPSKGTNSWVMLFPAWMDFCTKFL